MQLDKNITHLLNDEGDYISCVTSNGIPITKKEKRTLCSFINTLEKENANIVFRGDKTEVFDALELCDLSYRIFMLGPKAESFWKQRSIYLKKNICRSLLENIYEGYEKAFNLENIKSSKIKEHIKNFMDSESDFVSYFTPENKEDFYQKIKNLRMIDKYFVIDYYHAILHSMGNLVLHGSYQISTTTNFKISKEFSKDIIYIAWIPQRNLSNYSVICLKNMTLCNKKITEYKLPICSTPSVFPEQSEACMKFGILPHFLLGFIFQGNFVVNPNLFKISKSYDECINEGFYIDQSDFNKVLSLTKYKRSFSVFNGDYYSEVSFK